MAQSMKYFFNLLLLLSLYWHFRAIYDTPYSASVLVEASQIVLYCLLFARPVNEGLQFLCVKMVAMLIALESEVWPIPNLNVRSSS